MSRKPEKKNFLEKNIHYIVIAAVVLVVAAVYFSRTGGSNSVSAQELPAESAVMGAPSDGKMAPNFTLASTDGKTIKLSDYRGKVVVLDFWATWCPPCKAEIPDFIKLYSQYKSDGFQMLGISVDQGGLSVVKPFMKSYGINYPIMLANDQVVSDFGGISAIPTTFVIDKHGRVRASFVGYRPASEFEKLIQQLTKEK
jgi:peroxiredoxin